MRGLVPEAPTAVPLAAGLPRVLAEDDYARRFTSALDTVLAAAVGSYDNLTAYLDPATAPADFLAWLGHWVAAPPDEMGAQERTHALRSFVPVAAGLGARRGTAGALADELGRLCGVDVAVRDRGGVSWSVTAGQDACAPAGSDGDGTGGGGTGGGGGVVEVQVRGSCDRALVRRLVRRATPAHLDVLVTFDHQQPDDQQPDDQQPDDQQDRLDQEET